MGYDSQLREVDVTAVDTPTALIQLGGNTPGNFKVPSDAKLLTEIIISVGADWTADAMYGFSSGIQLKGAGLKNSGEYSFPGPCGGTCGAATTSAGLGAFSPQRYLCAIEVKGGNEIACDGYMFGEDCGSLHIAVTLVFDGVPGKIKDMDFREGNLTAANTPVRLTDKLGATVGGLKPATDKIGEIFLNAGIKAVAGPLRSVLHVNLYGKGIQQSGDYDFLGQAFSTQDDIAAAGDMVQTNCMQYVCGVGLVTSKGNEFNIQAEMIEDDVGTLFAIVGIAYY